LPFAGGPLAYGRRAVWTHFRIRHGLVNVLEALFATIGTPLPRAANIYYVFHLFSDDLDEKLTTTYAGLATVAFLALVQWIGSKRQAQYDGVDDLWSHRPASSGFGIACIPAFAGAHHGAGLSTVGRVCQGNPVPPSGGW